MKIVYVDDDNYSFVDISVQYNNEAIHMNVFNHRFNYNVKNDSLQAITDLSLQLSMILREKRYFHYFSFIKAIKQDKTIRPIFLCKNSLCLLREEESNTLLLFKSNLKNDLIREIEIKGYNPEISIVNNHIIIYNQDNDRKVS